MTQHAIEKSSSNRPGKPRFRGELALAIVIILNNFAVCLMLHSGAGISAVSSVPYSFSEILPQLSLGTWNYLFQTALVAALMCMRRKFVPTYLLAFVVGIAAGKMLDLHNLWITPLPLTPILQVLYFAISFFSLCLGVALSNHCKLPIIPTDLFPREAAVILNKPYKTVKTVYDLSSLTITATLSLLFLGEIRGIGIGTVFCAFVMGRVISYIGNFLDRHFEFVSFLSPEDQRTPAFKEQNDCK